MILLFWKKFRKKQGSFNPWPSHTWWSSLHPPLLSSTHTHLRSQCTTANCVKKLFFQNQPKYGKVISLQRNVWQNRNAIPFLIFHILWLFEFRAKLPFKNCVQLPILWKTHFFKFEDSPLCNEKSDRQKKYVSETPFLSSFFSYFIPF